MTWASGALVIRAPAVVTGTRSALLGRKEPGRSRCPRSRHLYQTIVIGDLVEEEEEAGVHHPESRASGRVRAPAWGMQQQQGAMRMETPGPGRGLPREWVLETAFCSRDTGQASRLRGPRFMETSGARGEHLEWRWVAAV